MGLFDKLFGRRASPETEQAKAIIRKAWEDSRKPQGAYKAATTGAEIRDRFFALIEEVEAKLGGPAIGIASAEGVLMVHPKLEEELRKQPDADVLEVALTHCFITTDARRRLNESWPSQVVLYRGKANSDEILREKSSLLAAYVVNNLDAAEMAESETSDEQDCIVRVEEVAVWYRVLDELAFRFIRGQRDIFMDFLQGRLGAQSGPAGRFAKPDRRDYGGKIAGVRRISPVGACGKRGREGDPALGSGKACCRADRSEHAPCLPAAIRNSAS